VNERWELWWLWGGRRREGSIQETDAHVGCGSHRRDLLQGDESQCSRQDGAEPQGDVVERVVIRLLDLHHPPTRRRWWRRWCLIVASGTQRLHSVKVLLPLPQIAVEEQHLLVRQWRRIEPVVRLWHWEQPTYRLSKIQGEFSMFKLAELESLEQTIKRDASSHGRYIDNWRCCRSTSKRMTDDGDAVGVYLPPFCIDEVS